MAYKLDLHVHTKYSFDSVAGLKRITKAAKKRGLAGIAITDHNTIVGARKLVELNNDSHFAVIVGTELTTDIGDIIGLFINTGVKSRNYFDAVEEIKSQGGIAVLAHPFKRTDHIDPEVVRRIDAVEVLNSRLDSERNRKAQMLARFYEKPVIGGSDAHLVSEVGNAYTTFSDISDLNSSILRGECGADGVLAPRRVHYASALVGNWRKGTLLTTAIKKVLP